MYDIIQSTNIIWNLTTTATRRRMLLLQLASNSPTQLLEFLAMHPEYKKT
jgi:hypothetical protein